ncbi:MAG TPA: 3-hydroxyisobutyrate dehydrogenase [Acetobacteraceae bacterium]|nr:3-hydroxyisobutyrate dehydrogenase [Acetobacteraceae bacterium]
MARIGFIGLGNMGAPMAANLLRAGHEVRGFDLTAPACAAIAAAGGSTAASAAEAVRGTEIVITMLPTGEHVRAVLTDILPALDTGALLIDSSTIGVAVARELHEAAAACGHAFLDAPVSGGTTGAAAGTLTFMVGGTADAFARARPVLAAMGRTIVRAGDAGAGQAAKLCNNLILGISMIAVAEGFALAERLGLSAQSLFDIASTSSGSCWSLTHACPVPGPVPAAPSNHDYAPGFATSLMLKDISLAVAAAEDIPRLGREAMAIYRELTEAGLGAKDFSIVAQKARGPAAGPRQGQSPLEPAR